MRKFLALVVVSLATMALAAAPASAASSGSTDATFELTSSGTLDVTVPASTVNLGSTAVPAVASVWSVSTFGTVNVVDGRSGTLGWVATATGTSFCIDQDTNTAGVQCHATDVNQQVTAANILYKPGTLSVSLGDGTLLTGVDGTLAAGATVSYTGTGNSDVSWNPTLDISLTATHVAGVYGGTVSHSVA